VAIANALQLEAARRRAVIIRFNFVAHAKFELAQPIRCRLRVFLLLIPYVTVWPWTLTPWPWTCVVSVPAEPWSMSVQNLSEIGQSAVELLQFELWPYDLEHVSRAPLCCGIVCTHSLNSVKLSVHEMWRFFSRYTSVCGLDALVKTCESELDKLDMAVNTRKSCCLRIGPRNNASCLPVSLLAGTVISWINEIRHLGIFIVRSRYLNARWTMPKSYFIVRQMQFLLRLVV